jgi:peroxiredoxin
MKTKISFCLTLLFICFASLYGQDNAIKPPSLGDHFPEFTLPVYPKGEFSLAQMRGKNMLLITSRGKYSAEHWCAICNYQYADFASLAIDDSIREKYNLEIVFLMPYSKEMLVDWENAFTDELKKIENWKYPSDTMNQSPQQISWVNFTRQKFPKTFIYADNKVPLPFPILMDENQELSKGLDLFRMEWNGGTAAQNIPAVYIIDGNGKLRFKYISQNTFDRPSSEYILSFIQKMMCP